VRARFKPPEKRHDQKHCRKHDHPLVHLEHPGQRHILEVADRHDPAREPWIDGREHTGPDEDPHHSPEQGIHRSLPDRTRDRPGAVSQRREPGAEYQTADERRTDRARLRVQLGETQALHEMNTERPNDHGREHDLHDREVLEHQLPDDDIVTRGASALKQEPEGDAEEETDEELRRSSRMKSLEHAPP